MLGGWTRKETNGLAAGKLSQAIDNNEQLLGDALHAQEQGWLVGVSRQAATTVTMVWSRHLNRRLDMQAAAFPVHTCACLRS